MTKMKTTTICTIRMTRRRTYGQWRQRGSKDNDKDNGDGTTDNNGNEDGNGATDDDGDGDGATDDNNGDDSDGTAADDDVVNNIDDDNLPPRIDKRNDGFDKMKTKEEERVGDTHNNQTDHREGGGRWRRLRRRRQRPRQQRQFVQFV